MTTYKINYLDHMGKHQFNIVESAMNANFVREEFIEDFSECTFVSIEIIKK